MSGPPPARILVTGTSRGLGHALAVELSRRGHSVIARARNVADLGELNGIRAIPLDVTDPASVEAGVRAAGEIDILVNNAAITVQAPLEAVPIETLQSVLETNLYGPLRLIHGFLPAMREQQRGLIVNVSSEAVRSAPALGRAPTRPRRQPSRRSARHFEKELEHVGVRVLVISAGGIRTEMRARQQKIWSGPYAALIEEYEARMAEYDQDGGGSAPQEIATSIADLIESPAPPPTAAVG